MDYLKFFDKAKENGIKEIEIKEEHQKINDIVIFNEKLEKYQIDDNKIINIKAIYNNKTINISLLEDEFDMDEIIELIKTNSKYIENTDNNKIIENVSNNKIDYVEEEFNLDEIINKLMEFNKLKSNYPLLKDISINLDRVQSFIRIINSNSISLEDYNTYYCISISAVAQNEEKLSTSEKIKYAKTFNELECEKLIKDVIDEAIKKLECSKVTSGRYNILLNNNCVAQILDTISSMFMADNIQDGKSLLCGKVNKKIFSDKLTIVEDATNEKLVGKRLFDDEGIKTKYKEIIKDGIFNSPLYNIRTALKDNVEPTGNGYSNISYRNMYILPSNNSYDELLKKLDNGIVIDVVNGMHAAINQINGNINLQAEGYIVKNGMMMTPIKLFTITTNIYELLNNILEIGSDLYFINTRCGSPSILLSDISISS